MQSLESRAVVPARSPSDDLLLVRSIMLPLRGKPTIPTVQIPGTTAHVSTCTFTFWGLARTARIRGGRASVRTTLYMAAIAAVHSNKGIAAFYERFRSNGKPFKVATTAVIRRRAILVNTLITENRKWEPLRP